MKAKKKRWSTEEEQVVIDLIIQNPNNLNKAFRRAAIILNRTPYSCKLRWYKYLSKRETTPVCFVTIGKKNKSINSKNGKSIKSTTTIWRKILNLLKIK
jgi:hypothetical protein